MSYTRKNEGFYPEMKFNKESKYESRFKESSNPDEKFHGGFRKNQALYDVYKETLKNHYTIFEKMDFKVWDEEKNNLQELMLKAHKAAAWCRDQISKN
jgi:hypothetical protein